MLPSNQQTYRIEQGVVILLILFFALLNILTIDWFPAVWIDEVSYSDPSVNFVLGKGFRSTAWASQSSSEFWSSNAPLHQYLLIVWLKLFGVSNTAVRSINIFYLSVASYLLWLWSIRYKVISTIPARLFLITLLWSGYIISFIYRNGRPDSITLLLAICTLYICSMPMCRKRSVLLLLIGALSIIAGIQLPPFILLVLAISWLILSNKKEIFYIGLNYGIGVLIGLSALLIFLQIQKSAYAFLTQTFASGFTITGDVAQMAVYKDGRTITRASARMNELVHFYNLYRIDIYACWMLIFNVVTAIVFLIKKQFKENKLFFICILASLLTPPFLLLMGRYPFYYSWMGYLLICLGTVFILSKYSLKKTQFVGYVLVIVVIVKGLPRNLMQSKKSLPLTVNIVQSFVEANLNKNDTVLTDELFYYETKKIVNQYYSPAYSGGRGLPVFPKQEAASIKKLIIDSTRLNAIQFRIGGKWEAVKQMEGTNYWLYIRVNS